jgi:protein-S-isoprenylcysteine O-methyltransferase Ste14
MQATSFEFRYRFWFIVVIYTLGFTVPWDFVLHLDGSGPNAHVWGLLAVLLSKGGTINISAAFNMLLVAAIVCAFAGAWLRTWGSAYLGTGVVHDLSMRGDSVVADGPYRHVRNPLYVGSWLNLLALALLMPASGAVFTIVLMVLFLLRLILGEEAFLTAKLGDPYRAYLAKVPRLLFSPAARVPASGAQADWAPAALTEVYMWGSALSFAVLGWRYNAMLLLQCVLVSVGVSLVVKAFTQSATEAEKSRG